MKNNKTLYRPPKAYPVKHDLETHQRNFQEIEDVCTMLGFDLEELSLLVEFDCGVTNQNGMPQVEPFTTGETHK